MTCASDTVCGLLSEPCPGGHSLARGPPVGTPPPRTLLKPRTPTTTPASASVGPPAPSWLNSLLSGRLLVTSQAYRSLFKTLSLTVGSIEPSSHRKSRGRGNICGHVGLGDTRAWANPEARKCVTVSSAASCKCYPPPPPMLLCVFPQYLLHGLWDSHSRTVLSNSNTVFPRKQDLTGK